MTDADVTRLRELCEQLVQRAEGDAAIARRLADAVAELIVNPPPKPRAPARSSTHAPVFPKARPRGGRRAAPVLDPFEVYRENPDSLPAQLRELDLEQLRDIVAYHGMDPRRLVLKWKNPERVITQIIDLVEARSRKGGAFRDPAETPQQNAIPVSPSQTVTSGRREDMSNIRWRRTQLSRSLIRCDHCGAKADTVHFLTDGEYPSGEGADAQVDAVFACPAHSPDPQGYYIELDRWFSPHEQVREHIESKTWGPAATAAIDLRFDQILREAADQDRR